LEYSGFIHDLGSVYAYAGIIVLVVSLSLSLHVYSLVLSLSLTAHSLSLSLSLEFLLTFLHFGRRSELLHRFASGRRSRCCRPRYATQRRQLHPRRKMDIRHRRLSRLVDGRHPNLHCFNTEPVCHCVGPIPCHPRPDRLRSEEDTRARCGHCDRGLNNHTVRYE